MLQGCRTWTLARPQPAGAVCPILETRQIIKPRVQLACLSKPYACRMFVQYDHCASSMSVCIRKFMSLQHTCHQTWKLATSVSEYVIRPITMLTTQQLCTAAVKAPCVLEGQQTKIHCAMLDVHVLVRIQGSSLGIHPAASPLLPGCHRE